VEFAGGLLPVIAPGLEPPEPVRTNPGLLDVIPVEDLAELQALVRAALDRPGSVGVIASDGQIAEVADWLDGLDFAHVADEADGRLTLVPASLAKGLEFDHVVVIEPARIAAAETRGLRRLYVVLTRAVSSLTIVHSEPLPEPLALANVDRQKGR
jgi:superfamily I DNA/RNA helicase